MKEKEVTVIGAGVEHKFTYNLPEGKTLVECPMCGRKTSYLVPDEGICDSCYEGFNCD